MRAFVSIDITQEDLLDSIARVQKDVRLDARPVRRQNMHMTLLFLGNIDKDRTGEIAGALESVKAERFDARFEGVGAFPNAARPRVLWVGTDAKTATRLKDIAAKIGRALEPLGFKADKFRAHLTIFRMRTGKTDISGFLQEYKDMFFGVQQIDAIRLKQSILEPDGPAYSTIAESGFR